MGGKVPRVPKFKRALVTVILGERFESLHVGTLLDGERTASSYIVTFGHD